MKKLAQKKPEQKQNVVGIESNPHFKPSLERKTARRFWIPPDVSTDDLISYECSGESLSKYGIFNNDIMLAKQNVVWADAEHGRICVIRYEGFDSIYAKFCAFNPKQQTVTVFNGSTSETLAIKEIHLDSIVVSIQRNLF